MDEEEVEEVDKKKDFDLDCELSGVKTAVADEDITMVDRKSFMSVQAWDSVKIVDYRIDEEEFHKFSLMDCNFFIRKPPDPDNDVYDFREMYVTPPDTDIYAIPRILAPMQEKYIRCAVSDYGRYNVTEPPIDAPRDPMYKSEREILKVTVPGGRSRDRKSDLLVIRDNGDSFIRVKEMIQLPLHRGKNGLRPEKTWRNISESSATLTFQIGSNHNMRRCFNLSIICTEIAFKRRKIEPYTAA